jgi:glycosyltransferase involved in cell wall biosynthesis
VIANGDSNMTQDKIVTLYPHFTYPGGATLYALKLTEGLSNLGYGNTIITQYVQEEFIQTYKNINFIQIGGYLPSKLSNYLFWHSYIIRINNIINRIQPDFILCHGYPTSYWAFILKSLNKKIQTIWICHEPCAFIYDKNVVQGLKDPLKMILKISNKILLPIDQLMSKHDYVVANSLFTKHNIEKIYGRIPDIVAYPGVDINEFNTRGNHLNKDSILVVGRLTRFKNIDIAIEAFNIVANEYKYIKLIIVGDGEQRVELEKIANKSKFSENIKFLGKIPRDKLLEEYNRALCLVYPSIGEPFGIVPLEAQAGHCPVIAFNSGGLKESIINNVTGILVEEFTANSLSMAIKFLIKHPSLICEMGKNGRRNVELNFSWNNTINNVALLLTQIHDQENIK